MEHAVYDGVDLADHFTVLGVHRPLPTPTPKLELVPGGNRYMHRGTDIVPPTITFRLASVSQSAEGKRADARMLARLLVKDGVADLMFPDDGGLRYRVVPSGELDPREFVRCGYVDVTFQAVEAFMRGAVRTASSSGGTATLRIDGSYPTPLKVTATSAVRNASSYLWGVRLDGADFMAVELPSSSSTNVVMDSDAATVGVGAGVGQITLLSDWLFAEPGEHSLVRHLGTGEFAVEWEERWL